MENSVSRPVHNEPLEGIMLVMMLAFAGLAFLAAPIFMTLPIIIVHQMVYVKGCENEVKGAWQATLAFVLLSAFFWIMAAIIHFW